MILKRLSSLKAALLLLALTALCLPARAVQWLPFGPFGGDARSLVADPHERSHLYLGTVNGWIYESRNDGREWRRLARLDSRDDLVLDSIVVDAANPKRILVGAWVLGSSDGGLYISDDAGITWKSQPDMAGQSIRAMAASASDPKILVAGTLKGVYRSQDGGAHWQLISPEGSREIHEVESVAIDPKDPGTIYAGTWHLPWKTTDDGEHWANIKQGVIDDSDVFSIIVDPQQPNVVYASACSGIYKSENGGEKFDKIQGIPSTARRTRVLMQDPQQLNVVFAGTTEGLFRTSDAGKTWLRTSGPELIVNDVYIDPRDSNHVLLATDRGGVLNSNDGGFTFYPSNSGFSSRQITSLVVNARQQAVLYVGVVNDKAWGGVFQSDNGGLTWSQQSAGLDGLDVFSLEQASDGSLLAGTGHGIYRFADGVWSRSNNVSEQAEPVLQKAASPAKRSSSRAIPVRKASAPVAKAKLVYFDAAVFAMSRAGDVLYAASSAGVLKSVTAGTSWNELSALDSQEWRFIAAHRSNVFVATLHRASLSPDGGATWKPVTLPEALTQVGAISVDGSGCLWVGGREGIFYSENGGGTWQTLPNFYLHDVNSLYYDAGSQRVLVTANNKNTIAFSVHLPDKTVQYWNSGWHLRMVRPVGDHLVGATLFDGVVIQPRMVASEEASGH
jgi:photosystem II stability/assembly factor-like uncharacterized protein